MGTDISKTQNHIICGLNTSLHVQGFIRHLIFSVTYIMLVMQGLLIFQVKCLTLTPPYKN